MEEKIEFYILQLQKAIIFEDYTYQAIYTEFYI